MIRMEIVFISIIEMCLSLCSGSNNLQLCTTIGSDGEGVSNADFVAYISAKTEGSCSPGSSTIAFAATCQMEDEYDRYRSIK